MMVVLKNRITYCILLIAFISCKKQHNNTSPLKPILESSIKEGKCQKVNLPLNIDFSQIGEAQIRIPKAKWSEIAPDGYLIYNLTLEKDRFLIKTKYRADYQIKFTISEVNDEQVTLLMSQIYYPFDDSLVFVKSDNKFKLKKAFATEYDQKKYNKYIREMKIISRDNVLELK